MFCIKEEPLTRLMEVSKRFHEQLLVSGFWHLIRNEPVIIAWIHALSDVDSELRKEQAPPDASKS